MNQPPEQPPAPVGEREQGGAEPATSGAAPAATPWEGADDAGYRPLDPGALRLDRLVSLLFTGAVAFGLLVTLALELIFGWWGGLPRLAAWAGSALFVLGLLWLSVVWTWLSHNATSYRVNEQGLEIRRGVLWRRVISVPRSRVQHTDVAQGPMQRRYGLATLTVHTAATRTPSVQLAGLAYETAMRIREDLRQTDDDDGV